MNTLHPTFLSKVLKNATINPVGALQERLLQKKQLFIKLGFDPTKPDIHLGHYVILNKLRAFQDAGHQVGFLIGDFTCLIGDPTGKNITRPKMTPEEVALNAATYAEQVFKILRKDRTTILYNSSWFNEFSAYQFIQLLSQASLAQIISRDDFSKRYREGSPIMLHELVYPLLQAYDSVAMQADVEIGGHDQIFNLLMGREIQKQFGLPQQVVITYPLLIGLDGQVKMSKSFNNVIRIQDEDMFGKILSISDETMKSYYNLMDIEVPEGYNLEAHGQQARDLKIHLAHYLVTKFFGIDQANFEKQKFITNFSVRNQLQHLYTETKIYIDQKYITLSQLLPKLNICSSSSQAHRFIKQGAVTVNNNKIMDPYYQLISDQKYECKFGKKLYLRIYIQKK